jgi:3-hydroxybutyryl-CoA dehydrogenase
MTELVEHIEKFGLSAKNRPKTQFAKVGVLGCGTVGQNITRIIAIAGIEVVFIELSVEKIQQALEGIGKELDYRIDHWGMTLSEKKGVLNRIHGSTKIKSLAGCDLVVEAIKSRTREERVSLRKEIFKRVEEYVYPETIIATNSTTIVITELSSELIHKDRCVSLHFSTSSPGANMVEVARGLYTSELAYANVKKFTSLLGVTMVPVEESPGLLSVRLFASMINESCNVLMEGVGAKEDIDLAAKTGLGMALGPFELADKIGLDKVVRWLDNLYNEFGDMKYKASPILKKLVRAQQFGRISGKGFYTYTSEGKKIVQKTY